MLSLLLVDDDSIALEGLTTYVDWAALGYTVIGTALSAQKAIGIVETEKVDVLLTDIVMPERGGLDLIQDALLVNPYIKAVILSGHFEFHYAKQALHIGAFDYLTKPVDFDELRALFTRLRGVIEKEAEERRLLLRERARPQAERAGVRDLPKPVGPVIETVLAYIDAHYGEAVTLQKLSEIAFVHPVYLSKLFKEKMNESFTDYLTGVRVANARQLLSDLSLRIYDISEMVGYDSPKHFSKVFKEKTGLTPKECRYRCHVAMDAQRG